MFCLSIFQLVLVVTSSSLQNTFAWVDFDCIFGEGLIGELNPEIDFSSFEQLGTVEQLLNDYYFIVVEQLLYEVF